MRTLAAALLAAAALGQDATTNAGVHRSALQVGSGSLPAPEEIRVYDLMNYHKHSEIAEPTAEERVALDARLLRRALPRGETDAALQIGVRTLGLSKDSMAPLNLAVVIDRSGSMADAGKLDFVKRGLEMLVGQLDEGDLLSLVVYDGTVQVIRAASAVSDPRPVLQLIRSIQPGGSTNLHGGLMKGYEEVARHLDSKRFAKVLLLSDGMANAGVVDSEKIVADSRVFNDRGIALSTIGIGLSFNDALMSRLAAEGKGTYHFLDNADAVERTFLKEFQGLVQSVARSPVLRVRLGRGVTLKKVYGYELANPEPDLYEFKLLDLPLSTSQVVLIETAVAADADVERFAEAELAFVDTKSGSAGVRRSLASALRDDAGTSDLAVLKNLTIARMAETFREACLRFKGSDRKGAADLIQDGLSRAEAVYGPLDKLQDPDLQRLCNLLKEALSVVR